MIYKAPKSQKESVVWLCSICVTMWL